MKLDTILSGVTAPVQRVRPNLSFRHTQGYHLGKFSLREHEQAADHSQHDLMLGGADHAAERKRIRCRP
jgi:hypothetical protein